MAAVCRWLLLRVAACIARVPGQRRVLVLALHEGSGPGPIVSTNRHSEAPRCFPAPSGTGLPVRVLLKSQLTSAVQVFSTFSVNLFSAEGISQLPLETQRLKFILFCFL